MGTQSSLMVVGRFWTYLASWVTSGTLIGLFVRTALAMMPATDDLVGRPGEVPGSPSGYLGTPRGRASWPMTDLLSGYPLAALMRRVSGMLTSELSGGRRTAMASPG